MPVSKGERLGTGLGFDTASSGRGRSSSRGRKGSRLIGGCRCRRGRGSGPNRLGGESDAAAAIFEGAGHFIGHFHFLGGTAGEQRGIDPRENFLQREADLAAVIFTAGIGEEAWTEAAEFAESDFDGAEGELVDDGIHGQGDGLAGLGKAHEFGLQINRQHADDGRERQLEGVGISGGGRGGDIGGFLAGGQRRSRRQRLIGNGAHGGAFPGTEESADESCKF